MSGILKKLSRISVIAIFEAFYIFIFILLMFCQQNIDYKAKNIFDYSNVQLLIAALLGITLITFVLKKYNNAINEFLSKNRYIVIIVAVIYFIILVITGYNIYFECAWDPEMLHSSANIIVQGRQKEAWELTDYYSTYPNNLMLTAIFTIILKINYRLGIFNAYNGIMSLIVFECILYILTALLVYKNVLSMTKSYITAFVTYIAFFIWGTAIWSFVPYSDATALIFPMLVIRLYQLQKNAGKLKKLILCIIMTAAATLGYSIKPQVLIMLIAIFIGFFLEMLSDKKKYNIYLTVLCIFTFFCCNMIFSDIAKNYCGIILNENASFSASHYLMMGLNEKENGTYSTEDVIFSDSYKEPEERKEADLNEAKSRLEDMLKKDTFAKHLIKKGLTNFADGTFAWGMEGNFITTEYGNDNLFKNFKLKEFLYPEGKNYHYYKTFKHAIWICLIFNIIFSFLIFKRRKAYADEIMIYQMALIGSGLFQMLFEARARYLYIYFPVYLIIAILAWKEIYISIKRLKPGR